MVHRFFPQSVLDHPDWEIPYVVATACDVVWQDWFRQRRFLKQLAPWSLAVSIFFAVVAIGLSLIYGTEYWAVIGFGMAATAGFGLYAAWWLWHTFGRPSQTIEALTKVMWPIYVLKDDNTTVLWDGYGVDAASVQTFEIPITHWQSAASQLQRLTRSLDAEAQLVRETASMTEMAETLGLTQTASPLIAPQAELNQACRASLAGTRPCFNGSELLIARHPAWLSSDNAYQQWEAWKKFVASRMGEHLAQWQASLGQTLKRWNDSLQEEKTYSEAALSSPAYPQLLPETDELTSSVEQLFQPVLDTLSKEIAGPLAKVRGDYNRERRRVREHYDEQIRFHKLQKESEQSRSRTELQSKEIDLRGRQGQINDLRQEIREKSDGVGSGGLHRQLQTVQARQAGLILAANTSASPVAYAQQVEALNSEQATLRLRIKTVADLETKLAREEEAKHEHELLVREAKNSLRRIGDEWANNINELERKRDAELETLRKGLEADEKELRSQVLPIEVAREEVRERLKTVYQFVSRQRAPTPRITPERLRQTILEFRRSALSNLRDRLCRASERLQNVYADTRTHLESMRQSGADWPLPSGEYLIPMWFVQLSREKDWRPLISLCEVERIEDTTDRNLGFVLSSRRFGTLEFWLTQRRPVAIADDVWRQQSILQQLPADFLSRWQALNKRNLLADDFCREVPRLLRIPVPESD